MDGCVSYRAADRVTQDGEAIHRRSAKNLFSFIFCMEFTVSEQLQRRYPPVQQLVYRLLSAETENKKV